MARETFQIKPIDGDADIAIGITLPFAKKQGGLFELSYTTEDQSISNLKSLILTKKGERPMRPNFGTGIWQKLFEKKTADFNPLLERELRNDIAFWLPYIIINDIIINDVDDAVSGMQEHGISISINFKVSEQGANQTITLNADGFGSLSVS